MVIEIKSLRLLSAALAAAAATSAATARADCRLWNPIDNHVVKRARPVAADDLIELAGFGRPDAENIGGPSPLAVSPDGNRVAFILQRADVGSNAYCQALIIVDLTGGARPTVRDRGGEFQMMTLTVRDMAIPNGFPRLIAPAWSVDGQSVAYLRRDNGSTQLWLAPADAGDPVQVTRAKVDVDAWMWGADGGSLVYTMSPQRLDAEQAIDAEGRDGWRYDDRTAPNLGTRPQARAPFARVTMRIDPDTGEETPATTADERLLLAADGSPRKRRSAGGSVAWTEPADSSPLAPLQLHAVDTRGAALRCKSNACVGKISGLEWDRDGNTLTYLKREGWNGRFTALYHWTPGKGEPRLLLSSDDVLSGCRAALRRIVCVREGASAPPRLLAVDPNSGDTRTIFDPNPSFGLLELGSVRRLTWRNDLGLEVYGDLVLPRMYRHRSGLPLVVVQYNSRGFLRGGTGNEYPIYLLAAQGFAVLSVEHPPTFATAFPQLTSFDAINAANLKDWAERRSINSALEAGVRLLIAQGIADPDKVGISGLSDGASAVRFALINSRLFAAAAISSCCVDESSNVLAGPAWERYSHLIGYPPAYPLDAGFWRPYSLVLNADQIKTPLLMQLADRELLYGLPTVTALRAHGRPVDLYTFPDEYHIKWQPVHRRAIYARNLDWFSFWLQDREDASPAKSSQFAHWRALRGAATENRLKVPEVLAPRP